MRATAVRLVETDEVLTGGRVRGWMLRAHLLWIREYGSAEDEAILAGSLLDGFDPDAWYPFASIIALDRAIAAHFADSVDETAVYEDLGRFSARLNLSMRFAQWPAEDHHRFFEESTRLHHELQDFGHARYRRHGATQGVMTLSDYRCFSRVYCASAAGWYEQCLVHHGAIRPVVVEEFCRCFGDEACVFELRWR